MSRFFFICKSIRPHGAKTIATLSTPLTGMIYDVESEDVDKAANDLHDKHTIEMLVEGNPSACPFHPGHSYWARFSDASEEKAIPDNDIREPFSKDYEAPSYNIYEDIDCMDSHFMNFYFRLLIRKLRAGKYPAESDVYFRVESVSKEDHVATLRVFQHDGFPLNITTPFTAHRIDPFTVGSIWKFDQHFYLQNCDKNNPITSL